MESKAETDYSLKETIKQLFDKKTIGMIILAFSALFLYINSLEVSLSEIVERAFKANFLYLAIGGGMAFIALALDSLAWWALLKASNIKTNFLRSYRVFMSTWSYQLLIPGAGIAEIAIRASVGANSFKKKNGEHVSVGDILPSVTLHKLLGLIAFIPLVIYIAYALTEFFGLSGAAANNMLLGVMSFSVLILVMFLLIARLPSQMSYIFQKLVAIPGKLIPSLSDNTVQWQETVDSTVWEYCEGFRQLWKVKWASTVGLVAVTLTAVSHWVSTAFIFWSFDIPITFVNVAAMSFIGGTILALPIGIPGGEGIMEIYRILVLNRYTTAVLSTTASFLNSILRFYIVVIVGILLFAKREELYLEKDIEEAR